MTEAAASPGIHLRPMALSDIDAVLWIERASFPTPWPRAAFFYELIRPQGSICLVAEQKQGSSDGRILGDIVVWLAGSTAHVATLAVHPDVRQKGVGSCLLANALLESIDRKMTESLLEVRAQNHAAQQLYQKFGYEVVGLRAGYYQDTGEDAVLMALKPVRRDQLAEFADCG